MGWSFFTLGVCFTLSYFITTTTGFVGYIFGNDGSFLHLNPIRKLSKNGQITLNNYEKHIKEIDLENATAIFNEVNNAVRQKNADLNPIGVSFFPAYIPVGTHLYHSTHNDGKIPDSFEWTAMDYEFSYNFAHFNRGKPGSRRRKHHGKFPGGKGPFGKVPGGKGPFGKGPHGGRMPPFGSGNSNLLTFEVTEPLDRLFYLGGASAAKSETGEMDTQYILSQAESYDEFNERWAAEQICSWGKQHGGIDGYIRLEIGFEVVICNFQEKLQLISNVTLSNVAELLEFPPEKFSKASLEPRDEEEREGKKMEEEKKEEEDEDPLNSQRSLIIDGLEAMSGYEQYESGERVYSGDNRILLDFSKFVTPLNRTYISPDPYKRRIYNISVDIRCKLVTELGRVLSTPNDPYTSTNWQVITTNIENKFGPILANLNTSLALYNVHENLGILGLNLTTYTFNFYRRYVNYPEHDFSADTRRMAIWDYIHPYQSLKSSSDLLILSSLAKVQGALVDVMIGSFELSRDLMSVYKGPSMSKNEKNGLERQVQTLQSQVKGLLDTLRWSLFYRCRQSCKIGEMCFIPTWGPSPLGWGNAGLGFVKGDDGRKRISSNCECISYRTLLEASEHRGKPDGPKL